MNGEVEIPAPTVGPPGAETLLSLMGWVLWLTFLVMILTLVSTAVLFAFRMHRGEEPHDLLARAHAGRIDRERHNAEAFRQEVDHVEQLTVTAAAVLDTLPADIRTAIEEGVR